MALYVDGHATPLKTDRMDDHRRLARKCASSSRSAWA